MIKTFENFGHEEIKTFELFTQLKDPGDKPSILYINGSRGWLKDDLSLNIYRKDQITSGILSQFGDHVIYGSVYWRAGEIIFEDMSEIIENNNIKAIIGNSAGGYASFYLSNKYKIPAMSINPAMADTSEAPTLQPVPEDIKRYPVYPKQLIVAGELDTKESGGVDMNLVLEYLDKIGFEQKGGEIITLPNTYHRISGEQFDSAFKHFYKKYIG